VQMNFAPILDVNHNYKNPIINIRSYSSDKDIIAANGGAFIRGLQAGNMLSTAKHFPGHGGTDVDSHTELPLVSLSKKEFEQVDLFPFREAVKIGVTAVMLGHLDIPAFDTEGKPATFSKEIVTDLLQHEIGFDGVIVTDALNMGAIVNNYSQKEAAELAVKAGNDILLFPADAKEMIDGLYEAVKEGRIGEKRIDRSVRKILAAKKWAKLDEDRFVETNSIDIALHSKSHKRLAEEIAEKSITLVKNDDGVIPINPDDYYATASIILSDAQSEYDYQFEKYVDENFNYVKKIQLNVNSKKNDYNKAYSYAKECNLVILSAFVNVREFQGTIEINKNHLEFIKRVLKLKKPVVVIGFGNPYILSEFPEAKTYICSYGAPPISQLSMINALLGRVKISGKLPIEIPNTNFKLNDGIALESRGLYFPKAAIDTNYDFTGVEEVMNKGLEDSVFPGAVLLIEQRGKVIYRKPFGRFTYDKISPKMTEDAIFDLASVSKVVGTTTAAMMLCDEGKLDLDEKVTAYLPEFGNHGKENITVRNLLMHNAGFVPWKPFYKKYKTAEEVIDDIMNTELEYKTGTETKYSDLGMITLQKVIEKISGKTLDKFLYERLFKPLGMTRTMYNPPPKYWYYCVPTEKDDYWRNMTMKGKVHDETAYLLNGVAGHAGLFSTADDIAKFMYMLLNGGKYGDKKFLEKSTIENWTTRQSSQSSRGLGWDTKSEGFSSAGEKFSVHSFGHTGFTGTSVWADKDRDLFVVLLTNRVYPTRKNRKIIKFRPKLHNAVIDATDYK